MIDDYVLRVHCKDWLFELVLRIMEYSHPPPLLTTTMDTYTRTVFVAAENVVAVAYD